MIRWNPGKTPCSRLQIMKWPQKWAFRMFLKRPESWFEGNRTNSGRERSRQRSPARPPTTVWLAIGKGAPCTGARLGSFWDTFLMIFLIFRSRESGISWIFENSVNFDALYLRAQEELEARIRCVGKPRRCFKRRNNPIEKIFSHKKSYSSISTHINQKIGFHTPNIMEINQLSTVRDQRQNNQAIMWVFMLIMW